MTEKADTASERSIGGFVRARLVALAELGAVGLAVLTVVTLFAPWFTFADVASNFRHIFAVLSVGPLVVLTVERRWRLVVLSAMTTVICLFYIGDSLPLAGDSCEPNLTVATVNALGSHNDAAATLRMLRDRDVDVVVVTELGRELDRTLGAYYPHSYTFPNEGTSGMGIFSHLTLSDTQKHPGEWFPQVEALVHQGGRSFRVLGIHPPPPFQPGTAALRNRELAGVADVVRNVAGPFILAGDFNLSRQSPHFQPLLDAGLVDSRLGRGIHGTWPAPLPLRVAIDHVLGTSDFEVCSLSTAPAAKSDHLPVIVGFRW